MSADAAQIPVPDSEDDADKEKEITPAEHGEAIEALKRLSDKHLALERQFDKEVDKLRVAYRDRQQLILDRRAVLVNGEEPGTTGIDGFWLQALQHHPGVAENIEKWDAPVLEHLRDIKCTYIDQAHSRLGFSLQFHFASNPYFENSVLSQDFYCIADPFTSKYICVEIRGCKIRWKPSKDVTVERVAQKRSKTKKEMQRESFFTMFYDLRVGEPLPANIDIHQLDMKLGGGDDADKEYLTKALIEHTHETGTAVFEDVIPYAIRWFTGEAGEASDEDDEEDSEEEDSED
jgi:nucleosome assembly protein 1-like 1